VRFSESRRVPRSHDSERKRGTTTRLSGPPLRFF
jgi:hypothetical protein